MVLKSWLQICITVSLSHLFIKPFKDYFCFKYSFRYKFRSHQLRRWYLLKRQLIFQFSASQQQGCFRTLCSIHIEVPYVNWTPRDNQRDREQHALLKSAVIGSKHLSGNNLPRISLIRGKLFPDGYLHPIPAYCFAVVSRVGCLRVISVMYKR